MELINHVWPWRAVLAYRRSFRGRNVTARRSFSAASALRILSSEQEQFLTVVAVVAVLLLLLLNMIFCHCSVKDHVAGFGGISREWMWKRKKRRAQIEKK